MENLPSSAKTYITQKLKQRYLVIYSLVVCADWLQGPHVYALYESYGLDNNQISVLFVTGFASSFILGTFIASWGDKIGRKNVCMLYGLFYGLSCMTKHSPDFWILMLGRVLAGIATSIMCTSFEAWLVCEHNKEGLQEAGLNQILSCATKANGLIAILAGLVAQAAVNAFSLVSPFDLALVLLIITSILVKFTWTENYGDQKEKHLASFVNGWKMLLADHDLIILGVVQSLFEGSMYIFVLQWTPALSNKTSQKDHGAPEAILPHGYIFSAFMVAVALGSTIFGILCKTVKLETILLGLLVVASGAFIPTLIDGTSPWVIFVFFLVFETCVGMFWPCMGALRSRYFPESCRATLMNYFRMPVNLLVVVVLLQRGSIRVNFLFCAVALCICVVLQWILQRKAKQTPQHRGLDYEGLKEGLISVSTNFSNSEDYIQTTKDANLNPPQPV